MLLTVIYHSIKILKLLKTLITKNIKSSVFENLATGSEIINIIN